MPVDLPGRLPGQWRHALPQPSRARRRPAAPRGRGRLGRELPRGQGPRGGHGRARGRRAALPRRGGRDRAGLPGPARAPAARPRPPRRGGAGLLAGRYHRPRDLGRAPDERDQRGPPDQPGARDDARARGRGVALVAAPVVLRRGGRGRGRGRAARLRGRAARADAGRRAGDRRGGRAGRARHRERAPHARAERGIPRRGPRADGGVRCPLLRHGGARPARRGPVARCPGLGRRPLPRGAVLALRVRRAALGRAADLGVAREHPHGHRAGVGAAGGRGAGRGGDRADRRGRRGAHRRGVVRGPGDRAAAPGADRRGGPPGWTECPHALARPVPPLPGPAA
jgi:hypothetical protein